MSNIVFETVDGFEIGLKMIESKGWSKTYQAWVDMTFEVYVKHRHKTTPVGRFHLFCLRGDDFFPKDVLWQATFTSVDHKRPVQQWNVTLVRPTDPTIEYLARIQRYIRVWMSRERNNHLLTKVA